MKKLMAWVRGAARTTKRNIRKAVPALVAGGALLVSTGAAHAQSTGSDPSSIVSSAGSLLTSIYPITLGAVSFGILIGLVKLVRRK